MAGGRVGGQSLCVQEEEMSMSRNIFHCNYLAFFIIITGRHEDWRILPTWYTATNLRAGADVWFVYEGTDCIYLVDLQVHIIGLFF